MSAASILVVDDEPEIRSILQEILQDENYRVATAENAARARQLYLEERPDLVLLDIWMPDLDGISLLKEWVEAPGHRAAVVMMSGHGTVETAVEAVQLGAHDFIEKPLSTGKLLSTIERVLRADQLRRERRPAALGGNAQILGRNPLMTALRAQIERAARFDTPVLIMGELGAGKTVAARALHEQSARAEERLVEINIAATGEDEVAQRLGAIDPPCTLILKEIGELAPDMQPRVLALLDKSRDGRPLVRLIATASRDLRRAVDDGRMRADFFYRLHALTLHVPALREHRDDIPELVRYFVDCLTAAEAAPYRRFGSGALNTLRNHNWPGNIRELKNVVRRVLILNRPGDVGTDEVEAALKSEAEAAHGDISEAWFELPLRAARDRFEKAYLEYHLRRTGGNMNEVAAFVEMERTHLYRKLKGLGLTTKTGKDDAT